LSNPGTFHWTPPLILKPKAPHYDGKVVILVDEVTQNRAEYTTMAFRAAPGALVVGSTTAGADGNVSRIPLPGDLFTLISGIGVFYPDRRPTQQVGIVPDVVVEPTIEAVRAGRDPVLEEALRLILGPKTPISSIYKMYRARSYGSHFSPSLGAFSER
jgi:C-terminal processing protease CtpA/Prc